MSSNSNAAAEDCRGEKGIMSATEVNSEKLVTDIKRVVRDSEDLLRDTAGAVGGKAHEMRERLSEAAESARRTCRRLEEKAIDSAKAADRVIHEHPYPSLGVAFALGLLIGVLARRR